MKTRTAKEPPIGEASRLLGAHMSIAGGVDKAVARAVSIGCTAMQIFVKSNMQWFAPSPFAEAELNAYHACASGLQFTFGHSGYMINLCAANPEFLAKSRQALKEELLRADQLKLPFLVLHPGAHMGAGEEAGLKLIVESLDAVFEEIPDTKTRVALETTAGQGSSLGSRFEHLSEIMEHAADPERLCVCLDTAHIFAAGYDITTPERAQKVFRDFDRLIGRKHLAALHLNDSKVPLGSRVDRHEHIGKGKIGLEGFRYIMSAPRFAKLPMVLETPKDKELREDIENLAALRGLIA
ncbi:MAG: deoxyribonuclease IV [Chthoniobacteraceae bacterium]